MSATKRLALGVLVWAASVSVVRGDPISSPSNFNWVAYFASTLGADATTSAPPTPAPSAPTLEVAPVAAPFVPTTHTAPAAVSTTQPALSVVSVPQPVPAVVAVAQTAPAPIVVAVPQTASPVVSAPQTAAPAVISLVANAPVAQPQSSAPAVATATAATGPVDAFINLGNGPYPLQSSITTGGAQPWFSSSQIASLFGGQPTAQQIQSFDNAILARVQQSFAQSGVPVTLTDNPNVSALHTVSLVSNTQSSSLSSAIGMTQIGGSGFSFIDKIAPSAQSLDQLEWITAHNISHELMLAFGVPENYDTTGNFIDSKVASWSMMVNPSSTFSPAAAQAISQALASQNPADSFTSLGAQEISNTPEPTAVALWALAGAAAVIAGRIRARKRS